MPLDTSNAESLMIRLLRQRMALVDECQTHPNATDAVIDTYVDRMAEVEAKMVEIPCQTVSDLAAKILAVTSEGVACPPDEHPIWAELRKLAGV